MDCNHTDHNSTLPKDVVPDTPPWDMEAVLLAASQFVGRQSQSANPKAAVKQEEHCRLPSITD